MTLVDNAPPITFSQLAHRFKKFGMTAEKYRRLFHIPLSFEDITSPRFASEIVGYRKLTQWFNAKHRANRKIAK
jgi:hypothetical protein